ncbi:MAG: PHP domain-containing protein [Chloroflexi bacterium]|nr:PHP domain-containing protein [Chloroflexota bacterium]
MVSATADVLGSADLHLHSLASDGLMTPEALVDHAELVSRLDVIAITDHDELSAAFVARDYAARRAYRVQVAVGVEITTREGHLLALFLEDRPPALRPALESADWVRTRGGLCLAPHPFTRWTHSLGRGTLLALVERGLLAGVEVLNASPAGRRSQGRALQFVEANRVASVGGSDAHMLRVVGLARTRFPGRGPDELRHAIETRATYAEGRFARPAEIAAEALPQLARALVHLPLRRVVRALSGPPEAPRRRGDGAAL